MKKWWSRTVQGLARFFDRVFLENARQRVSAVRMSHEWFYDRKIWWRVWSSYLSLLCFWQKDSQVRARSIQDFSAAVWLVLLVFDDRKWGEWSFAKPVFVPFVTLQQSWNIQDVWCDDRKKIGMQVRWVLFEKWGRNLLICLGQNGFVLLPLLLLSSKGQKIHHPKK